MKMLICVNPLNMIMGEVDGYIECSSTEENNGNKYLKFFFY